MNQIQAVLAELGLNPKEIDIYLTLMKVGSAPASLLGKRTGISRSTAQYTCQQLQAKGLVSMSQEENTFFYSVESSTNLLSLVRQQKTEIQQQEDRITEILPALNALRTSDVLVPTVRFYDGAEGIMNVIEELYQSMDGGEVLMYENIPGSTERYFGLVDHYNECIRRRIASGTTARIITPLMDRVDYYRGLDEKELRAVRYIPPERFPVRQSDFFIYKDTLVSNVFDKERPHGFIIISPYTAQLQRTVFDLAWEVAEEK